MKNWKTTLGGIINALAAILAIFGVMISPEQKEEILGGAIALATVGNSIVGLFAKDNNVTGGTKAATKEATERVKNG